MVNVSSPKIRENNNRLDKVRLGLWRWKKIWNSQLKNWKLTCRAPESFCKRKRFSSTWEYRRSIGRTRSASSSVSGRRWRHFRFRSTSEKFRPTFRWRNPTSDPRSRPSEDLPSRRTREWWCSVSSLRFQRFGRAAGCLLEWWTRPWSLRRPSPSGGRSAATSEECRRWPDLRRGQDHPDCRPSRDPECRGHPKFQITSLLQVQYKSLYWNGVRVKGYWIFLQDKVVSEFWQLYE